MHRGIAQLLRNIDLRPFLTHARKGGRVLLKFEAVDWQSEVYINGHRIGSHSGGYDGFEFDITDAASGNATAELVVGVCESGLTTKYHLQYVVLYCTPANGLSENCFYPDIVCPR